MSLPELQTKPRTGELKEFALQLPSKSLLGMPSPLGQIETSEVEDSQTETPEMEDSQTETPVVPRSLV